MNAPHPAPSLTKNVTRVSHLDLQGAGQVYVDGKYAYVGHITNKEGLATSILDVSDPKHPKLLSQIPVGDKVSHSHKARVIGDIMIVNMEQNMTAIGRKADELPKLRKQLREALGRDPSHKELAEKLGVKESDIPAVEAMEKAPYDQGGFKIYDVSDRAKPKLITHHKTHGRGVHRFDMDANYAYISTEMPGYIGNILVIYDIRNPAKPEEVSRWWLPGQHLAGGEKPTWSGRQHRLHHALRVGDRLCAGCWHGGVRVIDVSDIRKPTTIGAYNYHPPFPEPSHTFMGLPKPIDGRRIAVAIDEEDHASSAEEMAKRRGRPHGCLWVFDITDLEEHQAALDLRSERTRLAVEPRRAGPLRRAPVPGAHEGRRHADVLRVVRGRAAHRRHRRPVRPRGSRLLHSRARGGQGLRRRATTWTWTSAA